MAETQRAPEVLLLGFGGVGTLYAYILQTGGANVTAVCRSNYETVRANGIDVLSAKFGEHRAWRPTRVIREPEEGEDVAYDCTCVGPSLSLIHI